MSTPSTDSNRSLSALISTIGVNDRHRQFITAMRLSVPAVMAQLSAIIMELIDTAMVGSLGADASASIGLVATSTWLLMGLCSAASAGFCVQVAHLLGARNGEKARDVMAQGLVTTLLFSAVIAAFGVSISGSLPRWLGGEPAINGGATAYFLIFSLYIPVMQMSFLSSGMLRSGGNMAVPGLMGVAMCVLDVIFNFFMIFPSRDITFAGMSLHVPGAGMGVAGAATGTAAAEIVTTSVMLWYLLRNFSELSLRGHHVRFLPQVTTLMRAVRIALPMGAERFVTSAAQITITVIVAPLGACAIAANAFAVTAESICYMPGYGIADASTTLVGQSIGAGRRDLARSFGYVTVAAGIAVMTVMGVVLWIFAPVLMGIMSPVAQIVDMGTEALRIEAWAEPMFAASIVCYGVFIGAGDTLMPCLFNLGSMWFVRIVLAAILAPIMGLNGVWLAMCIELIFRGAIFLIRLRGDKWTSKILTD